MRSSRLDVKKEILGSKKTDEAVRLAIFAMMGFSIVAAIATTLLQLLASREVRGSASAAYTQESMKAISPGDECGECLGSELRRPRRTQTAIARLWAASHAFAFVLLCTSAFAKSPTAIFALVSLLGLPWAASQWAPLALISLLCNAQPDFAHDEVEREKQDDYAQAMGANGSTLPPGVAMGICNMAISCPQIISILVSSGALYLLKDGEAAEYIQLGWLIRSWGIFHVAAAISALRL